MFAIEIQSQFLASHQLRLPNGVVEDLHEHLWQVTVRVTSATLDDMETVMDFHILEKNLSQILSPWHHHNLNTIEPFIKTINPSAERIAERIAQLLLPTLPPNRHLTQVRLTEAPGCLAIWQP